MIDLQNSFTAAKSDICPTKRILDYLLIAQQRISNFCTSRLRFCLHCNILTLNRLWYFFTHGVCLTDVGFLMNLLLSGVDTVRRYIPYLMMRPLTFDRNFQLVFTPHFCFSVNLNSTSNGPCSWNCWICHSVSSLVFNFLRFRLRVN